MTNLTQKCRCSTCDMESYSIAGTRHRRCGGSKGAKLRAKPAPWDNITNKLGREAQIVGRGPHVKAGTWEPA